MWPKRRALRRFFALGLCFCAATAEGQQARFEAHSIVLTVVDEDSQPVAGALVTVVEPGEGPLKFSTGYAGRATFEVHGGEPYQLVVAHAGFYQATLDDTAPTRAAVRVTLVHQQIVQEQVTVQASTPGIDPQQTSDQQTMNLDEIVNVPYPTSRDIRNLLAYTPGIVQDTSGQPHLAGSETWATLTTLDGFEIRSPFAGQLSLRVSADAVRSIDRELTRYPVEYGRATGGVIAFHSGMGDNKFRFNATNFLPSFEDKNGLRFDKFVPRETFSGPLVRHRAWFFDGAEAEFDSNYIQELPPGADTNPLLRGSNLLRLQANLTPKTIVSAGLLANGYHSPYEGLSSLAPRQSTTARSTVAWLPFARVQQSFGDGALVDAGVGVLRIRDGYEPHGASPFEITPEQSEGSYFEALTGRSQRVEANAAVYLPSFRRAGQHSVKAGAELNFVRFGESATRAPANYLREDGTLERQSTFPALAPFTRHNMETGGYVEDRWAAGRGFMLEPGVRFDWDEIVRRPFVSPRLAVAWSPPEARGGTRLAAGVGLYEEHTQLEYLGRALLGERNDTWYAGDGVTPTGPVVATSFVASYGNLRVPRALNWSASVEQKLPGAFLLEANFLRKRFTQGLTYVASGPAAALGGEYTLTSGRTDTDTMEEVDVRHDFQGGAVFGAYTRSSTRTNAALDYVPTLSLLGAQQSGPLGWDAPNNFLSWGWLPVPFGALRRHWDLVYAFDGRTGFPYTPVHADYEVAGAAGSRRFPANVDLSPGLEWRFHLWGSYIGLRGVIENVTNSRNALVVNDCVDSPAFGTLSEFEGRAITARIRLIEQKP